MADVIELNYRGAAIRVQCDADGNPLYCAKDVCAVLGYSNSRKAVRRMAPNDTVKLDTVTAAGRRSMSYVTEAGLRSLILKSQAADAFDFLRWVPNTVWKALCDAKFEATNQAAAPVTQATPRELQVLLNAAKVVFKFAGHKGMRVTLAPEK